MQQISTQKTEDSKVNYPPLLYLDYVVLWYKKALNVSKFTEFYSTETNK